ARRAPASPLFPSTTLFRSAHARGAHATAHLPVVPLGPAGRPGDGRGGRSHRGHGAGLGALTRRVGAPFGAFRWARLGAAVEGLRSEEHTSELQSRENLVCR